MISFIKVRIEGTIEKLSVEESEKYFHSRPRDSQISAAVSNQSTIIPSRQVKFIVSMLILYNITFMNCQLFLNLKDLAEFKNELLSLFETVVTIMYNLSGLLLSFT